MNEALRQDSKLKLTAFGPLIYGIIKAFEHLHQYHAKVTTVYRRCKLADDLLQFYKPNNRFVWPSFTSTSTEVGESGAIFGRVLFVVTIRPNMSKFALHIKHFSQCPHEDEILLIANMAFRVTNVNPTPDNTQFPDTSRVIYITSDFVGVC
jgi:hypothetical protein